ncbi:MAG: hypothetical protein NT069_22105 [Planctomycetota bacterium]|nr:hypothetical protein [Planctomycetota bacterium]
MTRVIKDVLPVGRWKAGISNDGKSFRMFEVTPELLTEIRDNFSLAQSRGAAFNLGKSHGDPVTGLIPTDELIAPIDQIETDGNTLWAACYVTPSQAAFLSNPVCKVSAGVRQNWFDGQANPYSYQLVHIAVTDLPAVTGQGRFLTMSNTLSATTDPEETDAGEAMGGDSEVLSSSTKELWNRALSLLGLGVLADDVDEDNLETVVSALLNTLSQSSNDSADSADSNSDGAKTLPPLNPAVGANMTAELSNATPATPATQINLANSAVATPATPADPFAAITTTLTTMHRPVLIVLIRPDLIPHPEVGDRIVELLTHCHTLNIIVTVTGTSMFPEPYLLDIDHEVIRSREMLLTAESFESRRIRWRSDDQSGESVASSRHRGGPRNQREGRRADSGTEAGTLQVAVRAISRRDQVTRPRRPLSTRSTKPIPLNPP